MLRKSVELVVCAVLTFGSALALAQQKPAQTEPVTAKADPALATYWHDLASALARSTDAHALLTAALIDGLSQELPKPGRFTDLIALTQKVAPDDALVWWIAATQCRPIGTHCDETHAEARAQLARIDPQNASTWLLEMAHAYQAGDTAATRQALAKAAAATHDDDYMIAVVLMVADQIGKYPAPLAARGAGSDVPQTPERFAHVAAWAVASALVMPAWQPVLRVCTPNQKAVRDATLHRQCLDLARTLQHGDTLVAAGIGLAVEKRFLSGTAEEAGVDQRRRTLHWMIAQAGSVGDDLDLRSAAAPTYFAELRRTRNEPEALANRMSAGGIPLVPPADWQDPHTN